MELIVVSSPRKKDGEIAYTVKMFEAGLQRFHLRKPGTSKKYIKEFIEGVPKKYHSRIVIHSNHAFAKKYQLGGIHISKKHRKSPLKLRFKIARLRLFRPKLVITRSCHKLGDILDEKILYDYVFLSPVFDSISVNRLSGGFSHRGLTSGLEASKQNVIAMGGVKPEKLQSLADLGFKGGAVLGYIWSSGHYLEAFSQCQEAWKNVR